MAYDLEEIKRRADLERIADALGLQPKRSGRSVVCRCPAHNDQGRPNLVLSAKHGVKCFRCGFSGDVITLVEKAKGIDTKAAIEWLAAFVGVASKAKPGLGNGKGAPKGKAYPKRPAPTPAPVAYMPPTKQIAAPHPLEGASVAVADRSKPKPLTWPMTIVWPPDFQGGLIRGRWHRLPTGEIEATYNDREELKACLAAGGAWSEADETVNDIGGGGDAKEWRPTLRVEAYEALLSHCRPATDATPGAVWLRDQKGVSLDTQARLGVVWLQDWAKAADDLKSCFGIEALGLLGLMTRDRKTGKPLDLRFKNHRLIFPFFVTVAGRRSPVYVQARNIGAKDKRDRFDNPPGVVPLPYNADAIFEARASSKPVFVAEGVSDTLTLSQARYCVVGIVGSQGFKSEWVRHFDGLDVFIVGDGDEAGRAFNRKVTRAFVEQGRTAPKVVKLPEGQDVTDFFTKQRSKEVKQS